MVAITAQMLSKFESEDYIHLDSRNKRFVKSHSNVDDDLHVHNNLTIPVVESTSLPHLMKLQFLPTHPLYFSTEVLMHSWGSETLYCKGIPAVHKVPEGPELV